MSTKTDPAIECVPIQALMPQEVTTAVRDGKAKRNRRRNRSRRSPKNFEKPDCDLSDPHTGQANDEQISTTVHGDIVSVSAMKANGNGSIGFDRKTLSASALHCMLRDIEVYPHLWSSFEEMRYSLQRLAAQGIPSKDNAGRPGVYTAHSLKHKLWRTLSDYHAPNAGKDFKYIHNMGIRAFSDNAWPAAEAPRTPTNVPSSSDSVECVGSNQRRLVDPSTPAQVSTAQFSTVELSRHEPRDHEPGDTELGDHDLRDHEIGDHGLGHEELGTVEMTTRASSATLGDVRAISPASSFDSIHLPFWAKPLNQDRLKRDLRDIHTSLEITGVLLGRDIFDLEHQPLIDDFLKSLINDMVVVDHAACHEQLLRLGEEKLVTSWLGVTTHRIALQLNLDLAYGPFTEQAGSFQDWRANGLILGLELAMEERGLPLDQLARIAYQRLLPTEEFQGYLKRKAASLADIHFAPKLLKLRSIRRLPALQALTHAALDLACRVSSGTGTYIFTSREVRVESVDGITQLPCGPGLVRESCGIEEVLVEASAVTN